MQGNLLNYAFNPLNLSMNLQNQQSIETGADTQG